MVTSIRTPLLIVAAIVMGLTARQGLLAQDPDAAKVTRSIPMISISLSDGQFRIQPFGFVSWNTHEEQLLFLAHKSIRAELELLPEQQQRLDELIVRTRQIMSEFTEGIESGGELPPGFRQALGQARDRFQEELEEIFLPHQRLAVQQLLMRLKICREGLVSELFLGELGKKIGVTTDKSGEISRAAREIADRYRPRVAELRLDYFRRFMAILSDQQQQEFAPLGQDFLQHRLPPLEAIAWQLQNADELHRRFKEWPDLPYRGLSIPVLFKVDLDGQLVFFNPELSDDQLRRMAADGRWAQAITLLILLTREPWLAQDLELSDSQVALCEELLARLKDATSQISARKQGLSVADRALIARAIADERDQVGDEALAALDRVLFPIQSQRLARIAEAAELVKGGFRYALLYGQLGNRLGITPQQKQKIAQESEVLIQEFRQQAQTLEQEILDAFMKILDPEARQKLADLLGPELKTIPGNIDLLLEQLTHPAGR